MALTLEGMRADIAQIIGIEPGEIADNDYLPDLGLDSLRLMDLVTDWEGQGLQADFSLFAEFATLGEWWAEVSRLQGV